jgi:hypothetical protein
LKNANVGEEKLKQKRAELIQRLAEVLGNALAVSAVDHLLKFYDVVERSDDGQTSVE